ncbi:MAG: FAD-dependent oxidoreductase [Acidimicrobiales bacterium]|jgi:phytoene dehydrogenase-like protein|nr:FAD-dependent oxidoreductase [Acidimicrobiales bacterium]
MPPTNAETDTDVVIVGAGLAGLACARTLTAAGLHCTVLEAADGVGGRVRTDHVDGFRLDRGFQILLTAYPEAQAQLDYDALDLQRFEPGALVWVDGRMHRVGDPLRRPLDAVGTLRAPIGSFADKLRVLGLVASVRRGTPADLLRRPDVTTMSRLRDAGFSSRMIERFFRPLFAGIQLDPDLEVSRRRFDVILRMLAVGDAAVPRLGMGEIPAQLLGRLPDGTVRLGSPVERLEDTTAVLPDGARVTGRALVVATDGPTAARLTDLPDPGSRPAACVWFSAAQPPIDRPVLVLDGARSGPVRNLAVLSNVSRDYAPPGRALVAAAIPGADALGAELEPAARSQLRGWFGGAVDAWDVVHTHVIPHGHPDQVPPFSPKRPVRLASGRYVCGDHRDTASIQGALYSGRRCAEAVRRDLRRDLRR